MSNRVYSNFYEIPKGQASNNLTDACLVLEGGALRGLYTAGILDAFMLNDLNFKTVIGTSAGALTGANYVAGAIGRSARMNLGFRKDSRYIGLKAAIKNKGAIGFKFMFEEYSKIEPLNMEYFNNNERRFLACVTCLETGKAEYYEKGKCNDIFKACQASGSMPYISMPIKMNDKHYLDGGCSCKIPYKWAIDNGYKKIIVVRTRDLEYRKKIHDIDKENKIIYHNYPNMIETLDHTNEMYNNQAEELIKLYDEGKIFMIYPKNPITIGRLESDVQKLGELYELGYKDGSNSIKNIKEYLSK